MRLATWTGVWLFAAIIGGPPAAAQDGITCGTTYGVDGNSINLGPCGPPQPVYYAAVAISASTLNMGASHGQGSQGDAEQQALQICSESWLMFWSYDTSNGEQQLFRARVSSVNGALLDIEDDQNQMTYVVIAGVEFVRLNRDEAPYEISDVADESYDYVLGFQAGKYGCCVMTKDLRDGRNDGALRLDETQ